MSVGIIVIVVLVVFGIFWFGREREEESSDIPKAETIDTGQVCCYVNRVSKKSGLNITGQHCLRHTFATRCIEAGVSAVVLKTWLGHTDIHVTLDTYSDVFDRLNHKSVSQFEDYIANQI